MKERYLETFLINYANHRQKLSTKQAKELINHIFSKVPLTNAKK
jgi:hypothetical protein